MPCTVMPWVLDSLDLSRCGSECWRSGWCLWWTMVWPIFRCKLCYQETFLCTYLWWNSVYISLYRCVSCKYMIWEYVNLIFYDLGINVLIFLYFQIFANPTRNVNYKEKQNSEKIYQTHWNEITELLSITSVTLDVR